MATLRDFNSTAPRSLPVVVLADISGSMAPKDKIGALNRSVAEMLSSFDAEQGPKAEIDVAIITFGGVAQEHIPLQPASQVKWLDMEAQGCTPMGAAMRLATALVEDRGKVSSHSYRPTLVLVSDGQPTDEWEPALDELNQSARGSKVFRMALAIGADADEQMLKRFVGKSDQECLFRANDARQIHAFFQYLTVTQQDRARSLDPNGPSRTQPVGLNAIKP